MTSAAPSYNTYNNVSNQPVGPNEQTPGLGPTSGPAADQGHPLQQQDAAAQLARKFEENYLKSQGGWLKPALGQQSTPGNRERSRAGQFGG